MHRKYRVTSFMTYPVEGELRYKVNKRHYDIFDNAMNYAEMVNKCYNIKLHAIDSRYDADVYIMRTNNKDLYEIIAKTNPDNRTEIKHLKY